MARVLVIDDEALVRSVIAEILVDAGHEVREATNAEEGLEALVTGGPDLIVSDILMPGLSGIELLRRVREQRPSLPVVLVTGAGTYTNLSDALAGGADGLVMKPFSHAELAAAVAGALERAGRSERELRRRLFTPTLTGALANAIEARDSSLHGHCERLSALALRIACEVGLTGEELETVRLGAILHDIGKIGIPDRVLVKAGPFTPEERALMATHPLIGDRLLEPLAELAHIRPVVRHHHERWDGNGYPDGIAGDAIPLAARIVAVADAVEAMTGPRPYRERLEREAVVAELEHGRGTQWDPAVVDIALSLIRAGHVSFCEDGIAVDDDQEAAATETHSVLVVEDDPDHALLTRQAVMDSLERAVVVTARDLRSAEELCRGSTWSLIILDNNLPDGDGVELIETLRATRPETPVLVLTGQGSEELAVEAFRHGAADYVVKANGYAELLASRVRALVEAAA
jgi:putative two-component system response regulator